MGLPSDNKSQVHRDRETNDPAAFSRKPMLDEDRDGGLRGDDKRQGALRDTPADAAQGPAQDLSQDRAQDPANDPALAQVEGGGGYLERREREKQGEGRHFTPVPPPPD
jgi:hypothetical protein